MGLIVKVDADRQLNLVRLRGTSAMRCCGVFFRGNSLSFGATCSFHFPGLIQIALT